MVPGDPLLMNSVRALKPWSHLRNGGDVSEYGDLRQHDLPKCEGLRIEEADDGLVSSVGAP